MTFLYLLEGFAIGFLLEVPVGPIGVLCVRSTLTYGNFQGFIIGLSGASADIVYTFLAAFGITLVSDFIVGLQHWIRLGGGVLLFIIGFFIFRSHVSAQASSKGSNKHTKTFFSTFLLALTNPMTFFAFLAVFSAVKTAQNVNSGIFLPVLVAGIFFGSFSWFSLLTKLTYTFKKNITHGGLSIFNKVAGFLLMLFGVIALVSGANKF